METKTYDGQTGKFLAKVAENMPKIPASIMQGWIENPKGLRKVLTAALLPPQMFEIWKTIKLGDFQNADSVRNNLKQAGIKVSIWADDILGRISLATENRDIDITIVSVAELGFANGVEYRDICARAKELGLELCPAEVGFQLLLRYMDQSELNGKWFIAMEPITDLDGVRRLFSVERDDDGPWFYGLCSEGGHPDRFYYSDDQFVFALPQVK